MTPRFVPIALLAGLLSLEGCHPLEDAYCKARLPKAEVELVATPPSYILDQDRTARELGDAHANDGERITYGLTTATAVTRAEINLHVTRLPGAVCVRPDVRVTLAYRPMQIDLARELVRGSCPYETVLGHEMKHVEVYRAHLRRVAALLDGELRSRIANRLPLRYSDLNASEAAMQSLQDDWLVPRANELLAGVEAEQHTVDSAAEYARVASACPGDTLLSGASAPR